MQMLELCDACGLLFKMAEDSSMCNAHGKSKIILCSDKCTINHINMHHDGQIKVPSNIKEGTLSEAIISRILLAEAMVAKQKDEKIDISGIIIDQLQLARSLVRKIKEVK